VTVAYLGGHWVMPLLCLKKFWGGAQHSAQTPPSGRGHPLPTPHPRRLAPSVLGSPSQNPKHATERYGITIALWKRHAAHPWIEPCAP